MSVNSKYQVKWKGVKLGDHAFLTFSGSGNNDIRVIPRAKGVKIWSTYELGGGMTEIKVESFLARTSRITLEEYFKDLDSLFELNQVGDLVITDLTTSATYTLTNCFLKSYSQEARDLKSNSFTLEFVRSLG